MNSTILIFIKDFKSELRTKVSFNTQLLFTLTTISIILFSIGNEEILQNYTISFYWIVSIFAAMSGLSRVFVKEEERLTNLFLYQLTKSTSVFIGKLIFNLLFTIFVNFLIFILFSVFFEQFNSNFKFFLIIILGSIGIGTVSTIIAAIIAKVNSSTTLYTVLSFPILLPILMTIIQASQLAIENAFLVEIKGHFLFLISYNIALIISSILLFDYIWSD